MGKQEQRQFANCMCQDCCPKEGQEVLTVRQDIYELSDTVIWADFPELCKQRLVDNYRSVYGSGPFTVRAIGYLKYDALIAEAGHTQVIHPGITGRTDEDPMWSGAWFQKLLRPVVVH